MRKSLYKHNHCAKYAQRDIKYLYEYVSCVEITSPSQSEKAAYTIDQSEDQIQLIQLLNSYNVQTTQYLLL